MYRLSKEELQRLKEVDKKSEDDVRKEIEIARKESTVFSACFFLGGGGRCMFRKLNFRDLAETGITNLVYPYPNSSILELGLVWKSE